MKNELHILIIEDELLIAEMLKDMLLELGYKVATIARNYKKAVECLSSNESINFAILDINLNEAKSGIDVARLIRDQYKIPFIFLTSYSDKQTFMEAAHTKPEAYLIKPFNPMDIFTTLEIIRARVSQAEKVFIIKDGHLNVKLNHSDVLWVKSDNVYLEVKTVTKTYVVRNSLDKFLEELNDANFQRIHRSYAVNIIHVKAVNGKYAVVDQEKIPLSRKFRNDLMIRFQE